MCAPCSPSPCCNQSTGTACGDKVQPPSGLSAAALPRSSVPVPTGSDEISLAPTLPVSNVSHASPSNIRGGLPSSDSTIRGGIVCSDSTNFCFLPSRSAESSLSSSDLPDMDSEASSSDEEDDDERTISTVATDTDTAAADTDASLIYDMLHDDPEFDSLRLNSVVMSRVPDEVITIDALEEGETDDEVVEDKAYRNIQELKISEMATGMILTANRYEAHLDGGSQASTTNDKSVLADHGVTYRESKRSTMS